MWAWSSVYHTERLYVLSWSYNVDFFVCCLKILFILSIDDCDFSCGQRFVGTLLYTLHHEPWVICQFFSCRFNVAVIKSLWPRTSPFEFLKRCFLCQLLSSFRQSSKYMLCRTYSTELGNEGMSLSITSSSGPLYPIGWVTKGLGLWTVSCHLCRSWAAL